MNPNNNKIFTPQEVLKILNEAYEMIVNQNKYKLDLNTKKSLYEGFYAGFMLLLKSPDLPPNIKDELIAKKSMVDYHYSSNIKYSEYNMLKIHKSVANKTLKNNEYLNKKAKI